MFCYQCEQTAKGTGTVVALNPQQRTQFVNSPSKGIVSYVAPGLREGSYDLCHACGRPLSDEDQAHPNFELGVSCGHCIAEYSDADRTRFRERQRQVVLARTRGARHVGGK